MILGAAALAQTARADFPWEEKYVGKTAEWYRSDEGREAAYNVLTWQTPLGSWPKNVDTTKTKPDNPNSAAAQQGGTFDNGATRGEMRFIARAYNATADERYRQSFLKGIDHILRAQYDNGGWPQYFPSKDYNANVTFNDDVMVNLMSLMRDVAGLERDEDFAALRSVTKRDFIRRGAFANEFTFVDSLHREKAKQAFERGIDCILKAQIVTNGKPTAWGAQHDQVTLKPSKARSFEPVSLSGGESAGLLRLLMSLEWPTPKVIQAISAGCQWYEDTKLEGIRVVTREGDRHIIKDADAPPVWARFYEIGTNRPLFSDRTGTIRYDIAEIAKERRYIYTWYGDWGREVLADWTQWKKKHETSRIRPD